MRFLRVLSTTLCVLAPRASKSEILDFRYVKKTQRKWTLTVLKSFFFGFGDSRILCFALMVIFLFVLSYFVAVGAVVVAVIVVCVVVVDRQAERETDKRAGR